MNNQIFPYGYNPYSYGAYNNQYINPYQQAPFKPMSTPNQAPMQMQGQGQQAQEKQQAPTINPQGVIVQWVMGKAAAKSFCVPAGQTAFLFDTEKAVFYEKTVDRSGVPMPLRVHYYGDISDDEDEAQTTTAANDIDMSQFVKRDEIEEYIQRAINKANAEVSENVKEHISEVEE